MLIFRSVQKYVPQIIRSNSWTPYHKKYTCGYAELVLCLPHQQLIIIKLTVAETNFVNMKKKIRDQIYRSKIK